jgi:hypothetical protein
MDKKIKEKYGNDINKRIYLFADSLFVNKIRKSNVFLDDYQCDKLPKMINNQDKENIINIIIPSSDFLLFSPNNATPEITYSVKVDTLGNSFFYTPIKTENMDYILTANRKKLYNIAGIKIKELKWQPGQIWDYNINCKTILIIRFKN